MKKFRQLAVVLAALAVSVLVGVSLPVAGQQRPREDVLDALLVEVRGLRGAIEHMASAGARVQLVTSRLQLQEQRLNTLVPRLAEQRDRLAAAEQELAKDQARLVELQTRSSNPDGAPSLPGAVTELMRAQLDFEARSIKQGLAQKATEIERLRANEAETANLIATEQAVWATINRQLEELEALLRR